MKLNIIHKNSVLPADTFGMNQCKKTKYYNEGKTNPKTSILLSPLFGCFKTIS